MKCRQPGLLQLRFASHFAVVLTIMAATGALTGCQSMPAMSPVDLTAPGWSTRYGQAVWQPPAGRPELTGELFVGSHASGERLVEFTKPPFTLASARQDADQWRVEFGGGRQILAGKGRASHRWLWFELPRALNGEALGRGWKFTQSEGHWRLSNWQTGESLEGVFLP